jgi:N-acetylmuramoyl-L-alanine amidase
VKRKILVAIAFFCISLSMLILSTEPGRTQLIAGADFEVPIQPPPTPDLSADTNLSTPAIGCSAQATPILARATVQVTLLPTPVTLARFRKPASGTGDRANYTPPEKFALANPTNYGERFLKDLSGKAADLEPIVVLHETVGSASSAINLFQTTHLDGNDQSSYHTLIARDGTVIYLVPPDKRAFGAGNSAFITSAGREAVQTNPDFPASVNNFAYHISLESPSDGQNNGSSHSGYTNAQYQSLAWVTAKTDIPNDRITKHKIVDLSGTRKDPRSFDDSAFLQLLNAYPKTHEIEVGCTIAATPAPIAPTPVTPIPVTPAPIAPTPVTPATPAPPVEIQRDRPEPPARTRPRNSIEQSPRFRN